MDLPPHITQTAFDEALRIARIIALKQRVLWWMVSSDKEDFISESYLAVLEAVREWKPEAGRNFVNFAIHRAKFRIYHYVRKQHPLGRTECERSKGLGIERIVELDAPSGYDLTGDIVLDARSLYWEARIDAAVLAQRALELLSPRDRTIMVMQYWHGMSQTDIAPLVGLTQQYVGKLQRQALAEMREKLCPTVT